MTPRAARVGAVGAAEANGGPGESGGGDSAPVQRGLPRVCPGGFERRGGRATPRTAAREFAERGWRGGARETEPLRDSKRGGARETKRARRPTSRVQTKSKHKKSLGARPLGPPRSASVRTRARTPPSLPRARVGAHVRGASRAAALSAARVVVVVAAAAAPRPPGNTDLPDAADASFDADLAFPATRRSEPRSGRRAPLRASQPRRSRGATRSRSSSATASSGARLPRPRGPPTPKSFPSPHKGRRFFHTKTKTSPPRARPASPPRRPRRFPGRSTA